MTKEETLSVQQEIRTLEEEDYQLAQRRNVIFDRLAVLYPLIEQEKQTRFNAFLESSAVPNELTITVR